MVGVIKSSSVSQHVGIGAGGGAAVGALATLLSENPSLKKALRNALIGGAGGAALGGGLHALRAGGGGQVAPSEPAPSATPSPTTEKPKGMDLGISALTGLAPGLGPAVHGSISQDWKQGLGSGAASLGAFQLGLGVGNYKKVPKPGNPDKMMRVLKGVSRKRHLAAILASVLGATGAAAVGNKIRE